MMECDKCMNEQRILALEADKERNSEQHKDFYTEFKNIAVEDGKKTTTLAQVLSTVQEIKIKVDSLESKPAKKWESLSAAVVQWVVLAILAGSMFFK